MPLGALQGFPSYYFRKILFARPTSNTCILATRETGRASAWNFHFYKARLSAKTHLGLSSDTFESLKINVNTYTSVSLYNNMFLVRCYTCQMQSGPCGSHPGMKGSKERCMGYLKRWQNKVTTGNGGRGGSQGQIEFKSEDPEAEDS